MRVGRDVPPKCPILPESLSTTSPQPEGLKPSSAELQAICSDTDREGEPVLTFQRFVFLMTSQEDTAVQMGLHICQK